MASRTNLGNYLTRGGRKTKFFGSSEKVTDVIKGASLPSGIKIYASAKSPYGIILQIQNEQYLPMGFWVNTSPNKLENVRVGKIDSDELGLVTDDLKKRIQEFASLTQRQQKVEKQKTLAQKTNEATLKRVSKLNIREKTFENAMPLMMWVNPATFDISYSKIKANILTRGSLESGYVRHYWGDQQPQITFSGKTPAFFTQASGITRKLRAFSAGWHHMMAVLAMYSKNGCKISEDPDRIKIVGDVHLYYDNRNYTGSFRSLTISETDADPFIAEYSATFSVRSEVRT